MYPFMLYSEDSLNHFNDYARSCFMDLSREWFGSVNSRIEMSVFDAFLTPDNERQDFVFDESVDHDQVLISLTDDIKLLFAHEFIYHVLREDFDHEVYNNSNLLQQIVADSVNEFISRLSSDSRDADEASSDKSLMFKKGYGSIVLMLSNEYCHAKILLGPLFARQIAPALPKERAPAEPLNKIDLSLIHGRRSLNVKAYLNPTEINIKELSSLSVGDVLVLDHGITENVNLFVNDNLMCKGVVRKSRDFRNIQIETSKQVNYEHQAI